MRTLSLAMLLSVPAVAGPLAERKAGSISVSPAIGPAIVTTGTGDAMFGLFADAQYALSPQLSVGLGMALGFRSGLLMYDVGPQVRFDFKVPSPHVVFARGELPFKVWSVTRTTIVGTFTSTTFGLGVPELGAGYRYFLSDRLGVGGELTLQPSAFFSNPAGFVFMLDVRLGVELRL